MYINNVQFIDMVELVWFPIRSMPFRRANKRKNMQLKKKNKWKKKYSKSPKQSTSIANDDHLSAVEPEEKNEDEAPKMDVDEMSPADIQEAINIVKEIPACASEVISILKDVKEKIENGKLNMEKGSNFLHLRNLNMIQYLSNLSCIIHKKLSGQKIEGDPAVKRLAELRVVMQKMMPMEKKLRHEFDKLLACASGNIDYNDPFRHHAHPENFLLPDGSGDNGEKSEEQKENEVNAPPKISATHCDHSYPLRIRAHPDNLLLPEGSGDNSEKSEEQKENEVNAPPKISATHCDEKKSLKRKKRKQKKKKALEQAEKEA